MPSTNSASPGLLSWAVEWAARNLQLLQRNPGLHSSLWELLIFENYYCISFFFSGILSLYLWLKPQKESLFLGLTNLQMQTLGSLMNSFFGWKYCFIAKIAQGDLKANLHICSPYGNGSFCLGSALERGSWVSPAHITDACYTVNRDAHCELRESVVVLGWKTVRCEQRLHQISLYIILHLGNPT